MVKSLHELFASNIKPRQRFVEHFSGDALDTLRWESYANNGGTVAMDDAVTYAFSFTTTDALSLIYGGRRYGVEIKSGHSAIGRVISNIEFYIGKQGSPTGNAYFKVYNSSGVQQATSGALDVSTLGSVAFKKLALTSNHTIVAGDRIVCEFSGGDSSNYVSIGENNNSSDQPTNAELVHYNLSGGNSWGENTSAIILSKFGDNPSGGLYLQAGTSDNDYAGIGFGTTGSVGDDQAVRPFNQYGSKIVFIQKFSANSEYQASASGFDQKLRGDGLGAAESGAILLTSVHNGSGKWVLRTGNGSSYSAYTYVTTSSMDTDYHTFSIECKPSSAVLTIDGVTEATSTTTLPTTKMGVSFGIQSEGSATAKTNIRYCEAYNT